METAHAIEGEEAIRYSWLGSPIQAAYIECRTADICHTTNTELDQIDKQQDNFLGELGITRGAALIEFSLTPLSMRSAIALLGLLHHAAMAEGPPQTDRWLSIGRSAYDYELVTLHATL